MWSKGERKTRGLRGVCEWKWEEEILIRVPRPPLGRCSSERNCKALIVQTFKGEGKKIIVTLSLTAELHGEKESNDKFTSMTATTRTNGERGDTPRASFVVPHARS